MMEENTREVSQNSEIRSKLYVCFTVSSTILWFISGGMAVAAYLKGINLSFGILSFILAIASFMSSNKAIKNFDKKRNILVVIFALMSCLLAIAASLIIIHDWQLQENSTVQQGIEVEDPSDADNSLSVRSSCIPSDTLTAIFTDMNATIEVETNFEAARVTAQSVVDGVADDVIELSQTGTYSWSAKVRFEVAGTHNIEICVYLDNGECVTDVLTVEYPFT